MRSWGAAGLLAVGLVLSGCAHDAGDPVSVPEATPSTAPPGYDATLEPAAAVLAVVPASATTILVNDESQIRLDLGFGDVTSASPAAQRARVATLAGQKSAQLGTGLLRPFDAMLRARYGFGVDDVDWEASFSGGGAEGYAIKLRDDVAADGPTRAAADGVGVLRGATYYPTTHVFLKGGTTDPTQSWAADPSLRSLAGQVAESTVLHRGCLSFDGIFGIGVRTRLAYDVAADVRALEPISAFSLTFGTDLATARLLPERTDVFDRARLAGHLPSTRPDFGLAFADPVADPVAGRIGYELQDPAVGARLATTGQLPFAVCADS